MSKEVKVHMLWREDAWDACIPKIALHSLESSGKWMACGPLDDHVFYKALVVHFDDFKECTKSGPGPPNPTPVRRANGGAIQRTSG